MKKAVIRTIPMMDSVQIKVLPHLSSLEAGIIFLGGVATGYVILSVVYATQMRDKERDEKMDEEHKPVFYHNDMPVTID